MRCLAPLLSLDKVEKRRAAVWSCGARLRWLGFTDRSHTDTALFFARFSCPLLPESL